MKKNKLLKEVIVIAIIVLVLSSIVVTCTYIIQMPWTTALEQGIFVGERDYTPASVEFWVGFSGVLLSFVSIVMVIVTLVFQLYQLKLQSKSLDQVSESNKENFQIAQSDYNAYVLKLVETFLSSDMAQCRQVCWNLREELKHNENKLREIQKLFVLQIKDNWGTREEYAQLQKTDLFVDYAQFTKLIRYFDMMSHYKITEETAFAIHFYYVWWRSFFIQMIDCFMEAFNNIDPSQRHMTFPPDWCSLINRMDKQMKKYGLALA